MMKIGYILKKFPRLSETFILNEMLGLESLGYKLEIFSLRPPDEEPRHASLGRLRAPVTVIRPGAPRSIFRHMETLAGHSDAASREQLAHLCRRLDPSDPWRFEALNMATVVADLARRSGIDHIHAHFATAATATAGEASLRTGIPFSFTMHAKDIYREGVSFDTLSRRMEQAAFCVTVCEANAEWLRDNCGLRACRNLKVLYNGIDLEEWVPQPEQRGQGLFAAVGRFVEKKGFDDFLRACAIVRDRRREFRAVLVGKGENEAALRELVGRLNLHEWVQMPGVLSQEKVRELLVQSSLLAAPCMVGSDGNQDALPTVLLEAMALGTPCVATAVGGIREIIRSDEEGWIIPPRSPEALAAVMEEILDHPQRARKRGQAARRRIEKDFDLSRNVRRLADCLEGAWERTRTPARADEVLEVPVS